MPEIDYNALRLKNGIENAVNQALADIHVIGLQRWIDNYKEGTITAGEFLTFIESFGKEATA